MWKRSFPRRFNVEYTWSVCREDCMNNSMHSVFWVAFTVGINARKIKFSIKDLFSKCDQIHSKLWIWSRLLKRSLMENLIFRAVHINFIAIRISTLFMKENLLKARKVTQIYAFFF